MIGIRTSFKVLADVVFSANTTLATVGLTSPIAANQTQKIEAWVPVTTGATGGIKFQLVVPSGVSVFLLTSRIYDTVAQSDLSSVATSSAAIADPLANVGDHFFKVEAIVTNGATAGNIDLQCAQDSAANVTTILKGGTMGVTVL
jgi:hypothetical protein